MLFDKIKSFLSSTAKFIGKYSGYDSCWKARNFDSLSQQYTDLINAIGGLIEYDHGIIESNQHLIRRTRGLEEQIEGLQGKIEENKQKVQKYDELKSQYNELENLCNLRNQTIKSLRLELREKGREILGIIESGYKQRTETSKLSYIVIAGSGKVITSTNVFKRQFHFNDEDLIGSQYFGILKIPKDALDYIHNFKQIFRNPEEIKLQTTIVNGKGEEKIVVFEKEKPVSVGNYFYTKVHVHEVGSVKRGFGKVIRKLHLDKKVAKTVSEMIAMQEANRIAKEAEQEKEDILKTDKR